MLKIGDIVDIIFPSTCATKDEIIQLKKYIKSIGLTPRILFEKETTPRKNLSCKLPSYSGKARFKQLYEALKNSESKLVWCARGGYGTADILPYLQKSEPVKQNKIFIGFSDLTSISNFLQQNWHWQILCAPMALQIVNGGVNKASETELLQVLFGTETKLQYKLKPLNKTNKSIEAKIIGGCTSVFCANFGTAFQIDFTDKILFLEDIDETGEKLDRYFSQITQHILQTKQKPQAILLGEFTRDIESKILKTNINLAIKRLVERIEEFNLQIPVFQAQDKLGHCKKMRPLLLGAHSRIDVKNSKLVIS